MQLTLFIASGVVVILAAMHIGCRAGINAEWERSKVLTTILAVAAAMIAGRGESKEQAKSDYVFETPGRHDESLTITKVTNIATGRSVRVISQYKGGMVLLPSEF